METPKAICNAWYLMNGVKYCPYQGVMSYYTLICPAKSGLMACGMNEPDYKIPPQGNLSAWECPRCHKINAWFVRQCDCPAPQYKCNMCKDEHWIITNQGRVCEPCPSCGGGSRYKNTNKENTI